MLRAGYRSQLLCFSGLTTGGRNIDFVIAPKLECLSQLSLTQCIASFAGDKIVSLLSALFETWQCDTLPSFQLAMCCHREDRTCRYNSSLYICPTLQNDEAICGSLFVCFAAPSSFDPSVVHSLSAAKCCHRPRVDSLSREISVSILPGTARKYDFITRLYCRVSSCLTFV